MSLIIEEPLISSTYSEKDYPLQEESYELIGICMEIHKILGRGLLEIVYKDALEFELKNKGILFEREKEYSVEYKGTQLPHKFYADFVINKNIIVEIKAQNGFAAENYSQLINYLAISKNQLGLLINFGESSLKTKRIVL
jgi:GxxExxY protein